MCSRFTPSILQCLTRYYFVHSKFAHFKIQITKCITACINQTELCKFRCNKQTDSVEVESKTCVVFDGIILSGVEEVRNR